MADFLKRRDAETWRKVAVFPLLKNKPELVAKARAIYGTLKKHVPADYDEGGSTGKRYAR